MSVTPSFRSYVLDQLGRVTPNVRARSMFGGVGIYGGDLFFAVIDEDTVYFKVDDQTRPDFEARGMGPFQPMGPDGGSMQYYRLPEDILEDPEPLSLWVQGALGVALRKRRPKRKPRPPK